MPTIAHMSQPSAYPRTGQSKSHDSDSGRVRKNIPETTKDSLAAKGKDEVPLTGRERIEFWRVEEEEQGSHHETPLVSDDAQDDWGIPEDWGLTPLHELVQATKDDDDGFGELEKYLDLWRGILNVRSPGNQETALHMAIRKGFNKMALQLLAAGAKVNIENDSGELPLHVACGYGDQQLVEVLLRKGSDPEHKDASGTYPLHSAIIRGFEASVVHGLLGSEGFVINKTVGGTHWTPLNKAIWYECEDVVDILLEGGASLRIKDVDGLTPLMTAIRGGRYETFGKLLRHLEQNPTERDVVIMPDNYGMTPLMQLSAKEPGNIVKCAIEDLLQLMPDVNVTDTEGKTALHHAIASAARMETGPDTDVALMLVNVLSVKRLLHPDKTGETAFDIAFDKHKMSPVPAFEGLFNSLIDRLVQGGLIEEIFCWAAYRLERHAFARNLFQKMLAADVPQGLRHDQWEIVEWAIYARMPRVLLTYLRTLGVEKRVSQDDKTDKSISNGRELLEKLKEKLPQPPTTFAEEKRRKGELDPTSGNDSGKDAQVLRDMEDILEYLYLEKTEKPANLLELSKPLQGMGSSLNSFRAVIAQSNFVKFRTIQEVLYDDDSMAHIHDVAKRFKHFDYTPNASAVQAVQTSEEFRDNTELGTQFTWIHFPSTNMVWMEDTAKKILKEEGCDRDEAEKALSFLRSSWTEIPDRTSTSRFMMPQYVFKEAVDPTKHHAEDENASGWGTSQTGIRSWDYEQQGRSDQAVQTETEKREPLAVSAVYMPYLYFSAYHQTESGEPMTGTEHHSDLEKKVQDEIIARERLFKAYKNSLIHQPTTLDEFYYQFASDVDSVNDRNSRNRTQVVTKYLRGGDMEKHSFWPLLRVSQLWAWTIDEKWLITSTSCATNDIRDNLVMDTFKHVGRQVAHGSRRSRPASATEMSKVIVDYCIGAYDRKRRRQDANPHYQVNTNRAYQSTTKDMKHKEERSIHQIFSDFINEIERKEPSLFRLSYGSHGDARESQAGSATDQKTLQAALDAVAYQLYHIRDVRDELNILMSIVRFQRKVQSTMSRGGDDGDLSSAHVLGEIKELLNTTITLQETDIASFQSQIANWQASETMRQSEESVKQGKIVMAFTLVTVWFLPLSFLTSLFALDVESFMKAPAWAFYIIFFVPLIFLLSAVVYVYHTGARRCSAKLRDYVANLGTQAKGSGEKAEEGASTARFMPVKRGLRRRKGTDAEHV